MEINLENINIYDDDADIVKKTKMVLLFNALEKGWTIKKKNNSYIFTKNHEGKKEVLMDNYIKRFIETNLRES